MKIGYWIVLSLASLILAGCQTNLSHSSIEKASDSATVKTEDTLFVYADGTIQQIRKSDGVVVSSYPLDEQYTPITFIANQTFKVSHDQTYVVWFVPGKGMICFNTQKKVTKIFYEPTEWFYENPYFAFLGKQNILILIDKKGSEDIWINLDNDEKTTRSIPYPFGTLFLLSPDLQRIAYVEGYGQTVEKPSYLITTIDGEPVTQFDTSAEVANRKMIAWMPDSRSLVTVEDNIKLVRYPLEQAARSEIIYEFPDGEAITNLETNGQLLLIGTLSSWSVYDMDTQKLLRRLPVEAMAQLTKPRIAWFDKDFFYVEEDVRSFEQTFKRLWVSDWSGNKTILIPSYGRRVTQQVTF